MNQIINVQNNNGELLVSSREVAFNFGKEHKNVIQSIENLMAENSAVKIMFTVGTYTNKRNKTYKEYYMNRDGFSLLAMGFNGGKALQWKMKYISAFNQMKKEIDVLKEREILEFKEKISLLSGDFQNRLENLENTMTIDYEQAQILLNIKNSVCVTILGGKDTMAYKHKAKKLYSALWRDYKDYFSVNSYKNTARKDFDKAKAYLSSWTPSGRLLREIELINLNN